MVAKKVALGLIIISILYKKTALEGKTPEELWEEHEEEEEEGEEELERIEEEEDWENWDED